MKVFIITDSDLDGIVGGLILEYILSDRYPVEIHYSHPGKVDDLFLSLEVNEFDWVIFVDLFLNSVEYGSLRVPRRVTVIDHHKTTAQLLSDVSFLETYIDSSGQYCAAQLVYNYVIERVVQGSDFREVLPDLERLANLAGDWDLWQHKHPESKVLALAASVLEPSVMLEELKQFLSPEGRQNHNVWWISRLIHQAYLVAQQQINESKELAFDTLDLYRVQYGSKSIELVTGVCFGHTSVIADIILQALNRPLVAMILDLKHRHFSLRTNRSDVDLSELAKIYGGGGHFYAAGFDYVPVTTDILEEVSRFATRLLDAIGTWEQIRLAKVG